MKEIREAGELERKKNFEEERRKKRSWRERERERKGKEYFNERGERSVIIFFFFFLYLSYSTHLKIDVYYS